MRVYKTGHRGSAGTFRSLLLASVFKPLVILPQPVEFEHIAVEKQAACRCTVVYLILRLLR